MSSHRDIVSVFSTRIIIIFHPGMTVKALIELDDTNRYLTLVNYYIYTSTCINLRPEQHSSQKHVAQSSYPPVLVSTRLGGEVCII